MTAVCFESRPLGNSRNKPADALAARAYRVQIAPRPIVIDEVGLPVEDAVVIEITFPGETIDTANGPTNVIVGAGIAKITVAGETIRGVPLC